MLLLYLFNLILECQRRMGIGPVRTFGAIPPTTTSRAPPVHEATGGYALRCPSVSNILHKTKEMTGGSSLVDIFQPDAKKACGLQVPNEA